MSEKTGIEWCDSTFNPVIGCTKISPACDNCYAAQQDKFRHWTPEGWGGPRKRTSPANWKQPLLWNAKGFAACRACTWRGEHSECAGLGDTCPQCGDLVQNARRRVFCASLADVFDNQWDPQWRTDLFALIAATPNLDWLLLTKRIGNVRAMVEEAALATVGTGALNLWLTQWALVRTPPSNVWLGATIANQEEADRDIPKLLTVPARVRFLSMEPLLGPVDLTNIRINLRGESFTEGNVLVHKDALDRGAPRAAIDWVIAGGESGLGARPSHPDWYRSLRDQCVAAGVPFLFKQWGEWLPGQNEDHPTVTEPHGGPRKAAHHQDGRWGITKTKLKDSNYVSWDKDGTMRPGPVNWQWQVSAWTERVGKKAAGRLLDGVEHNGFPS